MNIQQTFPKAEEIPANSKKTWMDLLLKRKEIYIGFAKVEARNGLPKRDWVSLSTKEGQDLARSLWARTFEEVLESCSSTDEDHIKEELIDAVNFLLSLWTLDLITHDDYWRSTKSLRLANLVDSASFSVGWGSPRIEDFNSWLYEQVGPWFESLRNRSWQHSIQSHYYDGFQQLSDMVMEFMKIIFRYFEDYEDFMKFYIAKERVLIFRLETAY